MPLEMGPKRQVWSGRKIMRIPELEMFGWGDHMSHAWPKLHAHQHGAYEVCLITRGEVEWWAGLEVHRVQRGQVYLTRPGELHGGVDSQLHRCELYWVHLGVPGPRCTYGLNPRERQAFENALAGLTLRQFAGTPGIQWHIEQIHRAMSGNDELTTARRRNSALGLALQVIAAHDLARGSSARTVEVSPAIRASMDFISDHLDEDFRIDDAAEAAGMRLSGFHERFTAEVGLSPGDYRTRLRIKRAKELLLQTDWSVTRIALSLGFASSQYFATVFGRVAGMPPSRYRSTHQEERPHAS